jgi:TRAP-type C4-dicarboxylate transport system substrate-binding protein
MLPLYDRILQQKFNAKGLAMTNTGGLGIWSQKPVKTLEDLKGMLTASVSPVTSSLIKGLGASPVTIPFPDIYESLQKNVVDGAAQSAHGGVVFSFPDVCKNFTAFYGVPAPAGWSINLNVWRKMPPNIQKILLEETARSAEWMNRIVVTELPDRDLKSFKDKGVAVHFLSKAERDRWAKWLEAHKQREFQKFGALGQQIKKIADDANKKHPYKADKTAM